MEDMDADDLLNLAIGKLQVAYEAHVKDLADCVFAEIKAGRITDREDLERYIHETVDGDGWVIYTRKAQAVLLCSSNDGHGVDEGIIDAVSFRDGVPWSQLAYCALEQDLLEQLLDDQDEHGVNINEDDLGIEEEDEDEDEEPESDPSP